MRRRGEVQQLLSLAGDGDADDGEDGDDADGATAAMCDVPSALARPSALPATAAASDAPPAPA